MAPEAEATDVESARASTFKSGHTRLFTKYKGLFYIARIFRELVPAVLISFAMYGYVSSLWAARRGDSMIWHAMVPMRSSQLDKAAWHFALTKGETNPSCTAADLAKLPQPHEKVAHDLTVYDDSTKKGFNDCYWWQRVAEVVVYPRFGVEPGMRSWPAPKWQSGLGAGKAWSEGTDDLWCLAYKATSSVHVPYVRVNHTELGCGIAPEAVEEWANGWNTSYVLAEQAHFPSGDPGWEIILADNWPPSREGLCYSMCLDVAGVNEHTPAQQALDIAILFFLPVIIDLLLILVWLNQKTLYGGWVGTVSKKQRCTCKHGHIDGIQHPSMVPHHLYSHAFRLLRRPGDCTAFLGRWHYVDCQKYGRQLQKSDCNASMARCACLRALPLPHRAVLLRPCYRGLLPPHKEAADGKAYHCRLLLSRTQGRNRQGPRY